MINIIIVNYNCFRDTVECIDSILSIANTNFRIIIIDNNSTDASCDEILSYLRHSMKPISYKVLNTEHYNVISSGSSVNNLNFYLEILFLPSAVNLGFAGGNNIALKYLLKELGEQKIPDRTKILLLNPDTILSYNALNSYEEIDIKFFFAASQIKDYNLPEKEEHLGACKLVKPVGKIVNADDMNSCDYIYGGALLTNIATIEKVGILNEKYFLYWEEFDWCYRAKQKGISFIACKDAVVYDKVGGSTGRGKLAHYYYIRNGLHFYKSHFMAYLPLLFVVDIVRFVGLSLSFKFEKAYGTFLGMWDFLKGRFGYRKF